MIEIGRRQLITGLVSFIAAPAIVRISSIMPVRSLAHLELEDIDNSAYDPERILMKFNVRFAILSQEHISGPPVIPTLDLIERLRS